MLHSRKEVAMEELVETYLQHQSLEMVAHYVRTGRRFADLSTDDLRTRWAASDKTSGSSFRRGIQTAAKWLIKRGATNIERPPASFA